MKTRSLVLSMIFLLAFFGGCGDHETATTATNTAATEGEKFVAVVGGDIVEGVIGEETPLKVLVGGFPGSSFNFPAKNDGRLVFTSPGPAGDCPYPGIFTKEDGQPIKRLTGKNSDGGCDGLFYSRPTITSEGKVFYDTHNSVDGVDRIYSIPFDGGNPTLLAGTNNAIQATFRGGKLFYNFTGGEEPKLFSGTTGQLIPDSVSTSSQTELAPSHDGSRIVFSLGGDNFKNLAIFDGTVLKELTSPVTGVCDVQSDWTINEKKIIFLRFIGALSGTPPVISSCFTDPSPSVFFINADGSGLVLVKELEGATSISIVRLKLGG
ncbi:hypothetical protein HY061_02245 [Candidatus Azambacteria bacterium]|nr:hypothetical protein [Candidatus Azambacteria bacterium]